MHEHFLLTLGRRMYIVAIAWLYVALMMAIAEATHARGSLLGALVTFFLYGVGPVSLVVYLLATPARRRARRTAQASAEQPDARSEAAGDAAVAAKREEI